jgi:hypothetical protein
MSPEDQRELDAICKDASAELTSATIKLHELRSDVSRLSLLLAGSPEDLDTLSDNDKWIVTLCVSTAAILVNTYHANQMRAISKTPFN